MLRPLFPIAPMLKSLTATMLNTSRSYSSPKVSSSQRIAFFSDSIAWAHLSSSPRLTQLAGAEREQIRRLGVRVAPFVPMPTLAGISGARWIAVRQQHRAARLVGDD